MKLKNPIIPGYYPDPSICRVGEDYYLVNSSFEYFPGVPIWHSRDLVNWRQIGHCLTRASQLPLENSAASRGIWAPTIRYHDGRFYMITTNMHTGGHFYVWTEDPAGEWSEPVWMPGEGWDSSLFFDDDGTVYYQWFEIPDRIYQAEIDIASGKLLTEPRLIWNGTGAKSPEGPHLYKFFGKYYLLVAEGGTEYGHMISIARSGTPWGPWESCPSNPILSHRSLDNPIQATGHGDLFQAHDGSWWVVFLGIRPVWYPPRYHLGRETFLAPVEWNEDGWPVVGLGGTIQPVMEVEGLPAHEWDESALEPTVTTFEAPELGFEWNYLRNPRPEQYSLSERPGWLRLWGSGETISEEVSPAFVGRRQRHFVCKGSTRLDFSPQYENEEAGLTAFMNHRHHYEIGVSRHEGGRVVFLRRQIGSLKVVTAQADLLETGAVDLMIDADKYTYRFLYRTAETDWTLLGTGEVQYLTTEVGGAFTGVYFALYASGNGQRVSVPADFEHFIYEVIAEEENAEESVLEADI
ncbi:MAG: glycoside hydrolase family 43 protein [Anaerolineaceae bacterium]|nr:glycoside hydrolase family 43 protein [Anaerolineaceae bacterium]